LLESSATTCNPFLRSIGPGVLSCFSTVGCSSEGVSGARVLASGNLPA
jgi:hypothetical protein